MDYFYGRFVVDNEQRQAGHGEAIYGSTSSVHFNSFEFYVWIRHRIPSPDISSYIICLAPAAFGRPAETDDKNPPVIAAGLKAASSHSGDYSPKFYSPHKLRMRASSNGRATTYARLRSGNGKEGC